jgi:predicted dehydrogenase
MIKAGIVGLGWWGQRLLEAARPAREKIRFVHAVSPRPEVRREVAAAHGLRLSPDIATLLRDPEIEAVVLVTPHSMHADQIEQIARAGKPILCDKPLTLTRADAVRAVRACEQAGVLLAVGHNRRFLPALTEMKRILASGQLGRMLHVEAHLSNQNSSANFSPWRHDAEESPAGGLTGTGVHMLDCFVNLLGPLARVKTQLTSWEPPPRALDSLSVLVEFRNGMSGTLAMVRATPTFWRLHVFGSEGSAENIDEKDIVLRIGAKPRERISLPAVDTLRLELEAFADAVVGRAPYPVPYEQMIATVAAFEAITNSVAAGGAQMEVENG